MKPIVCRVAGSAIAWKTTLVLSAVTATAAPTRHRTITCLFLENGRIAFDVPAKLGEMPADIDSDYPAKAIEFSFRDGSLLLVAMDASDPTRPRIVISAQRDKTSGAYVGQIFVDMGGNQLMLHNGPVRCTIG